MQSKLNVLASLALSGLLLASCGGNNNGDAPAGDTTQTTRSEQNITIEPAEHGVAYPNAKIQIISPREGQVLANAGDSVRVVLDVKGMDIAVATPGDSTRGINYSKEGQHIHVIIDDKPYMANYKNGQPFNVGVLAPGAHTIRAFPSRSWHESVKSQAAFTTRTFYVGEKPAGDSTPNEFKRPFITYSRPKGNYPASDTVILLDFYATNMQMSDSSYRVKVSIDGKEIQTLSEWRPYHIKGLGKGEHTVALQLIDAQGNAVPGRFNNPSQKINIQ
jgi:hypothetical protein